MRVGRRVKERAGAELYMNLPNTLSVVRVAAVPLVIVLLLFPGPSASTAASIIFILVCLTDLLDGYLARKKGLVTSLGKFLDPLADKLLIVTAFIMLIPTGRVPAWVVALIVARETAVTGLRAVAASTGVIIAAAPPGKYKTVLQIISLAFLIIHYPHFGINFHTIGIIFLVPAFLLTMWSGADYYIKFFRSPEFRAGKKG